MRAARRWCVGLVALALLLTVPSSVLAATGGGHVESTLPTAMKGDVDVHARDATTLIEESRVSATLGDGRIGLTVHTFEQRVRIDGPDSFRVVDTEHRRSSYDLTGKQINVGGPGATLLLSTPEKIRVRSDEKAPDVDDVDWSDPTARFHTTAGHEIAPPLLGNPGSAYHATIDRGRLGVATEAPSLNVRGALNLYAFNATVSFPHDGKIRTVETGAEIDYEDAASWTQSGAESVGLPANPDAPGPGIPLPGTQGITEDDIFAVYRVTYALIDARPTSDATPYFQAQTDGRDLLYASRMDVHLDGAVRLPDAEGQIALDGETYRFDGQDVLIDGDLTLTPQREESTNDRASYEVQGDVDYLRIGDDAHTFESDSVIAVVIGLALGAGVLAYVWPVLKLTLFNAVGAPLYTRFKNEDALDHDVRGRIYDIIESDPGISISQIADRADVGWGTAVYHLGVLEDSDHVVSMRDGRYKRYYQNGGRYNGQKEVLAAIRNDTTRDVVDTVLENPGITQSGLCDTLDISAPLAHWHLDKLQDADVVQQERDGRYKRHYVRDEAQDILSAHLN